MKFLVTGGSGFLGINFIRYALENGHSVVSLDKNTFDYPEKNKKNQITAIVGDIRDRKTVNRCMEGVDVVVHTAAALPLYSKEEIFSTDVGGTSNILKNAYEHRVGRVIHISSTAVYGIPDHHPLIETDTLDSVGPYGKAKIIAEEICLEYREKGMCITILRPKSFVGPERLGVFALFYDWAKDGKNFPMIGNGSNRYQLLDVEDLCEAIYLCATKDKKLVNDTFNIGAKEFTTMKEDYQVVLDKAGFGKKIVGLPATPIIWTLRILEALHLSPLYKWVYETASKDSFVSIEKAERVLGYKPKYSNKQALVRNYEWYITNLDSFTGKSGVTHRMPWKQGVLGIAKMFF
jgi:nucleoside-diphosphate-sugar epimerase